MRRAVLPTVVATLLVACSPDDPGHPLGPASESPAPALALYGIGDLERAVPRPCVAPGYRQFDFWVGMWNIRNPAGIIASTSVITSELDGCVVMEDFITAGGFQGKSLSVYDRRDDRWYQSFVDNILGNYRLAGAIEGGEMVMSGSQQIFRFATGTFPVRDARVTWTANPDGSVRQRFVESFDGSAPSPTFDGLYLPAATLDRATPSVFNICRVQLPGARQLDFWLGSWAVAAGSGSAVGESTVAADLNDCLLVEDFVGPRGFKSRSYLFYDFVVDRWFRTYADNSGEHVELSGGMEGDRMVLTGEERAPGGRTVLLRLTIAPAPQGVSQRLEISRDGGEGWQEALQLAYRPAGSD